MFRRLNQLIIVDQSIKLLQCINGPIFYFSSTAVSKVLPSSCTDISEIFSYTEPTYQRFHHLYFANHRQLPNFDKFQNFSPASSRRAYCCLGCLMYRRRFRLSSPMSRWSWHLEKFHEILSACPSSGGLLIKLLVVSEELPS